MIFMGPIYFLDFFEILTFTIPLQTTLRYSCECKCMLYALIAPVVITKSYTRYSETGAQCFSTVV